MFFRKKVEVMSLRQFLNLNKPVYKILQIIPDKSIRNYQSEEIAQSICTLYKIPLMRFKREGFKITYNLPEKVSFFIHITVSECKFYIICPQEYANLFKEKCNSVWSKATIIEINDFQFNWDDSKKYQVYYEKQDALSLKIDKRCNEPLNNILNVLDIMEGSDQIGIIYNFIPTSQKGWREIQKEMLDKFKSGKPMEKEFLNMFTLLRYFGLALQWIIDNALGIINDFLFNKDFGSTNKTFLEEVAISNLATEQIKKISKSTREKGDEKILNTQILVMSKSNDNKRKINNAVCVAESFKILNENNNLIYKEIKDRKNKNVFHVSDFKIAGIKKNKMSTKECQNLIEIPAYSLIKKHKNIKHIQTIQTQVPKELTTGVKCLGICTYKEQQFKCYFRDDYNIGNLPLVILAPQNAGKTTFIANQIKDSATMAECNIVVDFIKNCELSKDVMKVINQDKVIVINCATEDIDELEGFGYNEIKNINESEFKKMETANLQSKQILALIDSMNIEDKPLTGQMRRYLSASANICCLLGHINVGDAIECLQNYEIRMQYIEELKSKFNIENNKLISKKISTLLELNEIDKSGAIIGTKNNSIKGILDRVSLLEEDLRMELAFNKDCENNTNLLDCMEQGKNIFILMPEHLFNDKISKNIMVTYWVSKIILAIKLRGSLHDKPLRCNVYIDELYQVPIAEALIKETLAQTRKFGGHWVFSCHYLNQLPTIKTELKNSGASYMLLKGTDIKNYEELKEDLEPYTYEDLKEMKQYQSMNLIQWEGGYAKFITQLPKPIVNRKVDE